MTRDKRSVREWIGVLAVGSALLLCYHVLYAPLFQTAASGIGPDYSYWLPSLLDGYYWYLNNGPWQVQWFTPAFCGGLPAFPNPHNIGWSLPYWLTLVVDPLRSLYFSFLAFAALGFLGFCLLLRQAFATSPAVAVTGAALFMFNGFYAHRLLVGHLNFQAFMLVPLVAYFLLRPRRTARWQGAVDCSVAGALLAYAVYAGAAVLMPIILLALVMIGLVHGLTQGNALRFWQRIGVAGAVALALCAAKLAPMLVFLGRFPREGVPLAGVDGAWNLLTLLLGGLFGGPVPGPARNAVVNSQFPLDGHEFVYGITLIPLVMIVAGAAEALARGKVMPALRAGRAGQWAGVGVLVIMLALPLAINYYTPGWNALLKAVPIMGNSSVLLRWFSAYIPFTILMACQTFDRSELFTGLQRYVAGVAIGTLLLTNFTVDRGAYPPPGYDARPVVEAYERGRATRRPPAITSITAFANESGTLIMPQFRNDTLAQGASQMLCYEALFGYRLETLPLTPLRPGPVNDVRDGVFNIKNPACYVYGDANDCKPGDHYAVAQARQVRAFAGYRRVDFTLPPWQRNAATLSLASALALLALWLGRAAALLTGRAA